MDSFPFVDSHAHLADPAFDEDREAVIARARLAGARAVVCIGESLAAAGRARAIAAAHRGFAFFTAGVHPHDANQFDPDRDPALIAEEVRRGARAIGECGLDYHYDHAPRDVQRRVLEVQMRLAGELGRPVVLHTREAEDDSLAALAEAGAAGVIGVLHCFTGSIALAERAIDVGWYVSFSGIITFKKWTDLDLLRLVPDDRLLAESDSPYLAPVPYRGKRNEPAWVTHTVARLAEVRGAPPERLGALVAVNASRFFAFD